MREDIYGGLKNAMERGISIESAIRSFINAGYKEEEVRAAAQELQTGALPIMAQQAQQYSAHVSGEKLPAKKVKPYGHKSNTFIIVLVIILLLSVASLITALIYKEQIAAFLQKLFK